MSIRTREFFSVLAAVFRDFVHHICPSRCYCWLSWHSVIPEEPTFSMETICVFTLTKFIGDAYLCSLISGQLSAPEILIFLPFFWLSVLLDTKALSVAACASIVFRQPRSRRCYDPLLHPSHKGPSSTARACVCYLWTLTDVLPGISI